MTEYRLTRESARAARACYPDTKIAEIVPQEGLTPKQVAELNIPLADIVWALVCACNLQLRQVMFFAQNCVGDDAVDARTYNAVYDAACAAYDDAYAARAAAAYAAREAADRIAAVRADAAYDDDAADAAYDAARADAQLAQIAELLRLFAEAEA